MKKFTLSPSSLWFGFGSLALCLLSLAFLLGEARILGGNSDEMVNINAIVNFWEHGDFVNTSIYGLPETQQSFSPYISTGPLALIPSLIGWEIHPSILYSRLACCLFAFLIVLALSGFAARKFSFSRTEAMAAASMAWILILMVPEWTFVKSLGELSGALWFLLGSLLWHHKKHWANLIPLGISVWLCKVTYLPAAGIFLFFGFLHQRKDFWRSLLAFMAPLVVWWLIMVFQKGLFYPVGWMSQLGTFLVRGPKGVQETFPALSWGDRLSLNLPRWAPYYKIIFYFFMALAVGVCAHLFQKKKVLAWPIVTSLCLSILFYDFWLLLGSPLQWPRHGQPALYLSVGLMVGLALHYLQAASRIQRRLLLSISLVCFCLLANNFSQSLFKDPYVRPELRSFKGLFLYAPIFSPEKYDKPIEIYQKLSQLSCFDLFDRDLSFSDSFKSSPPEAGQTLCQGRKTLPQTFSDDGLSLKILGYKLWKDPTRNDKSATATFFYQLQSNGTLIEDSTFHLGLKIDQDENSTIVNCQWQDRWQLGNFLISKTQTVFDLCAP